MPEVFITLVNMSINASWLVLAIILLRLLLKKMPKYLVVLMWALVGIRLIMPFSIESIFSLLPSGETIPQEIIHSNTPEIHSGIPAFNSIANPIISETLTPTEEVLPIKNITMIFTVIWLTGIFIMFGYGFISYLLIKRKVCEGVFYKENIFVCDHIPSPFILGIFMPKIYIPSFCEEHELKYVIAHENAHLKRLDHLWKPLGFLLLSIYWFNPLLWVAYILLCRDIESACDEKVIKTLGTDVKKDYSTVLVNFSHQRKFISACPVAFGETDIKARVKSILNYKKPVFWIVIISLLLVIILAVGFLTNPKKELYDPLSVFIDCQIADHHQGKYFPEATYSAIDYEILDTDKKANKTTVYMWVLYQEYTFENGQINEAGGAHIPTVITAEKVDSNYRLIEYWEPRDGSYYANDIKEKFPWHIQRKALDSQRYIKKQQESCKKMAEEYFNQSVSQFGGVDGPENVTEDIKILKEKYPQYFDINTSKGLEIFMWQENDKYVCAFTPGLNISIPIDTIRVLSTVNLEDARLIASTYNRNEIFIRPIKNPKETEKVEYLNYDEQIKFKHIFWTDLTKSIFPSKELTSPFMLDIDGDKTVEVCSVQLGTTSGNFTFKINAYENGKLEYSNRFISTPFSEFYFEQYGYFVTRKSDTDVTCYKISVRDGNIYLESNGRMVPYQGEQGVNENDQKEFDILVSDRTVSWEYSPTLSATWHYVFNLDFQCNQDSIEIFCDNGNLIDLNSSPQTTDTQFYLKDKNSIGWTPKSNVHEAPKNSVINFILRKNGHVTHTGEIHIYAVKTTDMTVTYQAYISSEDSMFFSKDAYGMRIITEQSSIK